MAENNLEVTVISDIMWPWCWIGKKKLEKAIDLTKHKFNVKVTWQPFLLRPNMPPDGVPKPADYGPTSSGSRRLISIGQAVGIDFTYKCNRFPYTLVAHCALEFALEKDPSGLVQNQLQEELFKAYFTDGMYPDVEYVVTLAKKCGLDGDEVKAYIENPENQSKTRSKAIKNAEGGVSGVPFFVINGQGMISGAQDTETLMSAFETAHEKFPLKPQA